MNIGRNINGIKWFFPKKWGTIRWYEDQKESAKFLYGRILKPWYQLTEVEKNNIYLAHQEALKEWKELTNEIRNSV